MHQPPRPFGPPPGGRPPGGRPPQPPLPPETPSAGRRGPIAEELERRQALERKIREEVEAKRRERNRVLTRIGLYVGGGLAAVVALWLVFKPAHECRRTDERKRAFEALLALRDPATESRYLERFDEKTFRCADVDNPQGTLIANREESGEAILWFVPKGGRPQSVNLLADAWTPRLGAGPELSPAQLEKVTK